MEHFDLWNILYYSFFGIFVYYQQLHVKNYAGASEIFRLTLTNFGFAGMITEIVFLIIYGIKVIWWAPIIIVIIRLLFIFVGILMEKLIGKFTISIIGFLAIPILAILMFKTMP
jgi:hypothetical protein